jgi:hypothetical protein
VNDAFKVVHIGVEQSCFAELAGTLEEHSAASPWEADGGHREKINRDHLPQMIVQECFPVLGRGTMRSAHHVFGDSSLGHRRRGSQSKRQQPGGAESHQYSSRGFICLDGSVMWETKMTPFQQLQATAWDKHIATKR